MRPRGVPRGSRTARKSLCVNGLPWQLRAVSRRRVATAGAAMTPGVFLDHNYLVIKDLPALRALPGVAAAPQRSIREGELRINHTMTGSRRTGLLERLFYRLTMCGSMPSAPLRFYENDVIPPP